MQFTRRPSRLLVVQMANADFLGFVRNFYRKCAGKVVDEAPAIWMQAKQQRILQKTVDEIGIEAEKQKTIRGWIKEFSSKKSCQE